MKGTTMAKKAVVLLAEGFEEIEAATPIDVLRRAGVEVTVAGVGGLTRQGAHGLPYIADVLVEDADEDYDLVVCPGGMPGAKNIGESAAAKALVEKAAAAGRKIAAICAAPVFTLGAWGLLKGKKATCYAGMETMFPEGITFVAEKVVVDGNVITSRGPATALPFALVLAEELMGQDVSKEVAKAMLV